MRSNRDRVDASTIERLLVQTGGLCPLPRCGRETWDYFLLDGDAGNLTHENLLPLCQTHYELAQSKHIPRNVLYVFKSLLTSQPAYDRPPITELASRAEYL